METQQENHTLSSIQDRFVNTAQYTINIISKANFL